MNLHKQSQNLISGIAMYELRSDFFFNDQNENNHKQEHKGEARYETSTVSSPIPESGDNYFLLHLPSKKTPISWNSV